MLTCQCTKHKYQNMPTRRKGTPSSLRLHLFFSVALVFIFSFPSFFLFHSVLFFSGVRSFPKFFVLSCSVLLECLFCVMHVRLVQKNRATVCVSLLVRTCINHMYIYIYIYMFLFIHPGLRGHWRTCRQLMRNARDVVATCQSHRPVLVRQSLRQHQQRECLRSQSSPYTKTLRSFSSSRSALCSLTLVLSFISHLCLSCLQRPRTSMGHLPELGVTDMSGMLCHPRIKSRPIDTSIQRTLFNHTSRRSREVTWWTEFVHYCGHDTGRPNG